MPSVKAFGSLAVAALAALAFAGCGIGSSRHTNVSRSGPPTLAPWTQVGDIRLGETFKHLHAEYGREGARGYRVQGGVVMAGSYVGGSRVTVIDVTSPYYRTPSGFGVGSAFPRRWRHAFIFNPTLKVSPCHCWVKIGTGARSLRPGAGTFLKPWVIVHISHGRVTDILMSSKYVD